MQNINRRESERLDISLSCHVTSPVPGWLGAMRTENISRNGVLIAWGEPGKTPEPPGEGQMMAIEIELPAHHGFGRKCIHCEGSVSRVDCVEGRRTLVALHVNYMDFRDFHLQPGAGEAAYSGAALWMA
jgi:hypothetical protein